MKSLFSKTLALSFVFVSTAIFSGCSTTSTKVNQDLDSRLQAMPDISSYEQLGNDARQEIKDSGLSADKKAQLPQVQRTTQDKSTELRSQSYKLRALLIQDLASKQYDGDEVEAIKARLKKIEDQRLQLIYTAADQINTILGHDREGQNARIIRSFDFEGHAGEE
jgi:hypothetical protein